MKDMEIETLEPQSAKDSCLPKRLREENEEGRQNGGDDDGDYAKKRQKVDKAYKSLEEEMLAAASDDMTVSVRVDIGPKSFNSSVDLLNYFHNFMNSWSPNVDINKYEHLMLLDLFTKGHAEEEKKTAKGIKSFQVRHHPIWKKRLFFLIREDASVEGFNFKKCVSHIFPLPKSNNSFGGNDSGRSHGRGGGNGRN